MKQIIVTIIVVITLSACTQQKIGYVDSSELVKEYKAVKELEKELATKRDALQAKYQQIALDFEKEVKDFQKNARRYSQRKGEAKYQELMQKQQQIQQTQQAESAKLQKEGQEQMNEIIDDVKDFVKEYAKTNGYTYILGSNEAGSVLYGDKQLNLTETILEVLNKEFKDNKKESSNTTEEKEQAEETPAEKPKE